MSGKGVVEYIEHDKPAVCMIEIVMDEKDGIEVIGEIGKLSSKPKIIAMSSTQFYLDLAMELGVDASLLKPFSLDELNDVLQKIDDGS